MKTIITLVLLFTFTAYAQWEKLPLYGGHAEKLVQSKFNPNDIFAITAKSGVWYSSDGGENWRGINGENNILVGMEVWDLEVTSDGVFWIISYWESIWRLYKSTDRGKNWGQIPTITGTGLNVASRIESANDGSLFLQVVDYTLGGNYSLLKSPDNGFTWSKLTLPREADYRYTAFSMDSADPKNVSLYGSRGFCATTTDLGANWIVSDEFYKYRFITDVTYFLRQNDLVIGLWTFDFRDVDGPHWYFYYESNDKGKTWIKKTIDSLVSKPNSSGASPHLIPKQSDKLLLILWNTLYQSTDYGQTWNELIGRRIWDLVIVNGKYIGSFTFSGIESSPNEGINWNPVQSIETFSAFESFEFGAASGNNFFVIVKDVETLNSRYELRQSTDRGQTWKTLFGSPSLKNLRVTNFPESRYYAVSTGTAIISGTLDQSVPDTILTWIPVKEYFLLYNQYYQLELSDAQPGLIYVMAFTSAGRKLFSSSDVGKNWTSYLLPGVSYKYFEIFPSRVNPGWVVAKGGPSYSMDIFGMGVLLSTNYGSTWDLRENKDPGNSSYSLSKDDLLFDSFQRLFSKDYGRTWFRNEEGILDSMKGSVFAKYPSGNHLIIARGQEWYEFLNDRWIPITDGKGNKLSKGLPTELDVVGSDFYGIFSHDGLYRIANTNITSVRGDAESESNFVLQQNYPNPFSDRTSIDFTFGKSENARLQIRDIRGKLIKEFHLNTEPGQRLFIDWDGKDETGVEVPTGIYFCGIQANGKTLARQIMMTIIR